MADMTARLGEIMDTETILRLSNVNFIYDDGTKALKNLSLKIHKGEKLVVLGANGSGKSTLFLCLNGVNIPSTGEFYYREQKLNHSKKELLQLRRKIGIVFQEPDNQLFCADIVGELSFGLFNLGYSKDIVEKKINEVIRLFHLEPLIEKPTHFLSAGQKKLVSIAEIVAMEPDIIILDEPFAALDPKHTEIVKDMIDTLYSRGITVIQSTHDVDYAYEWADRVLLMEQGQCGVYNTPVELFQNTERLENNHLKKPVVLRILEHLQKHNKVQNNIHLPKNIEELIPYL